MPFSLWKDYFLKFSPSLFLTLRNKEEKLFFSVSVSVFLKYIIET